jgi:hypothetical protein
MLVILALRRLRQEDLEFGASLSYMARTCLQKERKKKKKSEFKKHNREVSEAAVFFLAVYKYFFTISHIQGFYALSSHKPLTISRTRTLARVSTQ